MIGTNLAKGTEIICRDARPRQFPISLRLGAIYTIRGYSRAASGYVSVLLNEALACQDDMGTLFWPSGERGFWRDRFDLLTVAPVFQEMLERAKAGECLIDGL